MRVLYIGGLESAQKGAIGTHTSGIISGFQSNGIEVEGLFLRGCEPHAPPNEINIIEKSRFNGRLGDLINRINIARRSRNLKSNFDIVYHRYDPILSPMVANMVSVLEYNDDVLNQVEFVRRNGGYSFWGGLLRRFLYPSIFGLSEWYCFKKAERVVCVTEMLCDVVHRRQPAATTMFLPNASLATYDERLTGERGEVVRLAHVGTLTHWDGLIELLDAVKEFISKRPHQKLRLDIVGSGSLHESIQKKILLDGLDSVVFMHKPVSHDRAIEFLHDIDVVPLLKTVSEYGLSPIKFYEALCLGKYLICTDIPHISDIDREQGIVVPYPIQSNAIVTALSEIVDNINLIRQKEPARARDAYKEHSWSARVQHLLSVLPLGAERPRIR